MSSTPAIRPLTLDERIDMVAAVADRRIAEIALDSGLSESQGEIATLTGYQATRNTIAALMLAGALQDDFDSLSTAQHLSDIYSTAGRIEFGVRNA